jgi:two-component system, OmpR family, alkaline phosphatase synthesis response regulator PhoP
MSKKKILIIEDERDIVEMVKYNLEKEGYSTVVACNGREGFSSAKKERPSLIILDLMLPDIDGFEVCRLLKNNDITNQIPIIMLTAKSREADRVAGLELGADDYVTKPFSPRELIARIRAVLRRNDSIATRSNVEAGVLLIDTVKHKVFISGKEISLTLTEFKILEFMVQRPGVALSRGKLLDGVFGYDSDVYDRTIDAHIKSLRKKLGEIKEYIETVRGVGYRFKEL